MTAAHQAGAADYAPVDLDFARRRYQDAQTAMDDGKYALARDYAEESLADARLAEVRAQLAATRRDIRAQQTTNARLRARLLGPPASASSNGGLPQQVVLPQAEPASAASSQTGGQP